jgi:amino acid transporter
MHRRFQTPVSAAILTGVIASAVLILYAMLASSAEDLFWTIFAFSSVVFLLPYFLLFLSFLRLRRIDPDTPRPYRVPGRHGAAAALSGMCMLFIAQAVVFFIYKPGAFDASYALAVGGGTLLTVLAGEIMIRVGKGPAAEERENNG